MGRKDKYSPRNVSKEVRSYMQRRGFKQEQLALQLGVNRSQVTRWANPKIKANRYTIYFLMNEGVI